MPLRRRRYTQMRRGVVGEPWTRSYSKCVSVLITILMNIFITEMIGMTGWRSVERKRQAHRHHRQKPWRPGHVRPRARRVLRWSGGLLRRDHQFGAEASQARGRLYNSLRNLLRTCRRAVLQRILQETRAGAFHCWLADARIGVRRRCTHHAEQRTRQIVFGRRGE